MPVRRELRAPVVANDPLDETMHAKTAREKTSARRLAVLRRHTGARARLLEIGVRDASFGAAAAREFEYVGIDRAPAAARAARAKGLEVYCSTLTGFVNTEINKVLRIEFFSSTAGGQGETFLGFVNLSMGPNNTVVFTKTLTVPATVLFYLDHAALSAQQVSPPTFTLPGLGGSAANAALDFSGHKPRAHARTGGDCLPNLFRGARYFHFHLH